MIDAWYGYRVDARLARYILNATGTPVNGPQLIGTRPNLVAAWALAAQGIGLVSGTVTEQGSGAPLAGVEVSADPTGAGAVTDASRALRAGAARRHLRRSPSARTSTRR